MSKFIDKKYRDKILEIISVTDSVVEVRSRRSDQSLDTVSIDPSKITSTDVSSLDIRKDDYQNSIVIHSDKYYVQLEPLSQKEFIQAFKELQDIVTINDASNGKL